MQPGIVGSTNSRACINQPPLRLRSGEQRHAAHQLIQDQLQADKPEVRMAIQILGVEPSPVTLQATRVRTAPDVNRDLTIFNGVVLIAFKGTSPGPDGITRDDLAFNLRDPIEELADLRISLLDFQGATCSMGPASIAYDGPVTDALWAVDGSSAGLVNEDRGSGTANIQLAAGLAVRGANDIILRVNYTAYVQTFSGAINIEFPLP
jgi:hypothetical protein